MHTQNLVEFYHVVLKKLNGNEILNKILTSIKGYNSIKNVRKMMCNNPNLDLANINAYSKFGEILSTCSQDIERKQNCDGQSKFKHFLTHYF